MRRALALLALVLALLHAGVAAAAEVAISPEPDWIDAVDVPDLDPALYRHVVDGQAFRLVDRQIRWQDGRRQTYARLTIEVVNRSGLEAAATITRDFDPEIETMGLVRLDILRGGARIPVAQRVRIDLLRREKQLEAGIIDGTLTAHIAVPGVRVGDIVDAAFLWDSGEYLPDFGREIDVPLEFAVPVALSRLVVHWPRSGWAPRVFAPPQHLFSVTPTDAATRLEWRYAGGVPRGIDEGAPWDYSPFADVTITPHPDWEAVARRVESYYTATHAVPDAWRDAVEAIRAAEPTEEGRAYAALRLVQEDIRYVGLEVGAGGYFARLPDEVVENGFGDCKDKTMLLRTVLADLGIDSHVALANMDYGHGLAASPPRIGAFDHMILGARLGGRTVYMDPTRTYEGGVGASALEPDLGYVLPVTLGRDDLVLIPADRKIQFFRRMVETFTFTRSEAIIEVETLLKGESARRERELWAMQGLDAIAAGYLRYYQASYPGIVMAAEPTMQDDLRADEVKVRERYRIPATALKADLLWRDFPFSAEYDFSAYPRPTDPTRRDPLWLPHRTRIEHRVEVRNAPIDFAPPETRRISSPAFDFRLSASAGPGGRLVLDWSYETRLRSVAPDIMPEVVTAADEARNMQVLTWDFGDDAPPAGDWLDRLIEGWKAAPGTR